MDDDAGVGNSAERAVDAHLLELVGRGVDARGVDKAVAHAVNRSRSLDGVAGGAGDIRDHSSIFFYEGVKQSALAYVGFTDNCHINTIFECLT